MKVLETLASEFWTFRRAARGRGGGVSQGFVLSRRCLTML